MTDDAASEAASDDIGQRVARGAALLDEMVPGWDARIDLEWLDVKSYSDCVLGQTFDNSTVAMNLLGLEDGSPYGFEPAHREGDDAWPALDAAWRSLIIGRRSVDT